MNSRMIATLVVIYLLAMPATALAARPVIDCSNGATPFSTRAPLIDILLSPAAKAVIDRELPSLTKGLPPIFANTTAPTFAAILNVRELAAFQHMPTDRLAPVDAELARIPVTAADRLQRCARYDNDHVRFALPPGRPRLLLFEKVSGFRDGPSLEAAHLAFTEIAARRGWSIVTTQSGGAITPKNLALFDAVIWNNVSGDVLTLAQRRALRSYLEGVGGFLAVHGSGVDPIYFWDWYADKLIGARFAGHPSAKQFQKAHVRIDDPADPIARDLPLQWDVNDEWYSFKDNPRTNGAHVIATLDETSYEAVGMGGQDLRMGDHPLAWTRKVGRGRSFYSAIGHLSERYNDPVYVRMLENAIMWASSAQGLKRTR